MVDWNTLGTLVPRHFEWQIFATPTINTDVFRVRHLNGVQMSWGYALLSFLYPFPASSERHGTFKIFPLYDFNDLNGEASEIIICPIPRQFIQMNLLIREAIILLPKSSPYVAAKPWTITLEESNLPADTVVSGGGGTIGGDDIGGGIP